ncbi:MAG TPA: DMT family transporter [Thermohalobaculum sp.]|nr:DMT family transporter [Thermohalobaculum sp.]
MSRAQDPTLAIRFVLLATLLFALQDGISKHLAAHYPVPWFVMFRYWFFALFVVTLASRMPGGVRAARRTSVPVLQAARGVLLAVQIIVIVISFDLIGLAPTHTIFALHPLLATLLAIPVLGERVGWRRLAAVGVGFLGVLVILRPGAGVFDWKAGIALFSALMFASYSVLTRLASNADGHSRASFFYTGVAGAAVMTLIGPFFATPMTWPDIGWLAILSLTGMTGHYCLIRALDAAEAVRIQPFVYLQMTYAVIIGWLVFGEPVDRWMIVGMTMIVGAGLYAIWREARVARMEATPG